MDELQSRAFETRMGPKALTANTRSRLAWLSLERAVSAQHGT